MTKNILITGSKGQLGSELQKLLPDYEQFNFFPTDIDTLDLTDREQLADYIRRYKIDYMINCAAYTAVDKAEDDPDLCYRINKDVVGHLAQAAKEQAKIIHISTDYVFDGSQVRPYKETDPAHPQTVYGKSKKEGEDILFAVCPESIVIRTSWLYSLKGPNFVEKILELGKEKEEIRVVADQKGTPTYAADLAKAILDILVYTERENHFPAGVYHYSNEGETTWFGFAKEIIKRSPVKHCRVYPVTSGQYPTKARRPAYSVLDKTKIKETFQLTIPLWEDSLQHYFMDSNA